MIEWGTTLGVGPFARLRATWAVDSAAVALQLTAIRLGLRRWP